jgi:hypothetical protein
MPDITFPRVYGHKDAPAKTTTKQKIADQSVTVIFQTLERYKKLNGHMRGLNGIISTWIPSPLMEVEWSRGD